MGHSRAEKAKSHDRILDIAAARIREAGLDAINLTELMQAAGLTHGGFYRHFTSRGDLIGQALARAFADGEAHSAAATGDHTLRSKINSYLSRSHRDEPARGCAIAALAGDIARADTDARALLADRLEASAGEIGGALSAESATARREALAIMSTLVGALTLSRAVSDPAFSNEILQSARESILSRAPT